MVDNSGADTNEQQSTEFPQDWQDSVAYAGWNTAFATVLGMAGTLVFPPIEEASTFQYWTVVFILVWFFSVIACASSKAPDSIFIHKPLPYIKAMSRNLLGRRRFLAWAQLVFDPTPKAVHQDDETQVRHESCPQDPSDGQRLRTKARRSKRLRFVSWRLFDKALLLAFFYPTLLVLLHWLWTGDELTLGTNFIFSDESNGWIRFFTGSGILVEILLLRLLLKPGDGSPIEGIFFKIILGLAAVGFLVLAYLVVFYLGSGPIDFWPVL